MRVDDQLRTSAEGVYAAGDVAGTPQFTHASWNDFRVLRDILDGKEATTAGRLIPWAVFTTPELGHVDLTETQARAQGRPVRVTERASSARKASMKPIKKPTSSSSGAIPRPSFNSNRRACKRFCVKRNQQNLKISSH